MSKPKSLIAALAVVLFFSKANAQNDTTHFDLGHMQLRKDFTQNITIKGSDLKKMPFTNLAEAINVWFYGTYSNTNTLVYIIDGNLVNDVNAYSIYDIDEVTLVQNSVSKLAGAVGPQQLVLIKTRRAKTKGLEVTAAGQANLSSQYTNNLPSDESGETSRTTVYQEYYAAVHQNTGNMQFGVSADYTRDALPELKDPTINPETPENLERIRLNGYFDVKLGSSVLDVTAGYVPQKDDAAYTIVTPTAQTVEDFDYKSHLWNGTVKLTTTILPGLTNVVHGDYNNYRVNDLNAGISEYNNSTINVLSKNESYAHNIVAYDNLSYNAKFGDWGLEPAVNLTFRTLRDSSYSSISSVESNGNVDSYSTSSYRVNEHTFLLTPSVNLYYKNYFNIQGGLLYNIASKGGYTLPSGTKTKKTLPFISASADVMQLIDPSSTVSVKVYGSYAITDFLNDNANTLPVINPSTAEIPVAGEAGTINPYDGALYTYYPAYSFYTYQVDAAKTFRDFSAGLSISPKKSGLVLSYFFEHTNYLSPVYFYIPFGSNLENLALYYYNTGATLNRISLGYNLVDNATFKWESNVNATMLKTNMSLNPNLSITSGNSEWTGGWANRLSYGNFSAGVDVLYQLHEKVQTVIYTPAYTVNTTTVNSFSLQNLYVGYSLKVKGLHALELFANGRNLFQNKKADITDNRRYFGLGFRATL